MFAIFNKKEKKFIKNFTHKDILIFFIIWYFIITLIQILGEQSFKYTPLLTDIIRFLVIFSGRFIFLSLIILYLVSLYDISFTELGLKPHSIKDEIYTGIYLGLFLIITTLIFINLPLSQHNLNSTFNPLYFIQNTNTLISSLLIIGLLIIPNLIIALSELFILNNIIFELFNFKIGTIPAFIFSGLFYSFFTLTFIPEQILINFFVAVICIFLYIKTGGSLYLPTIFMAFYNSVFICYIYGFDFLQF